MISAEKVEECIGQPVAYFVRLQPTARPTWVSGVFHGTVPDLVSFALITCADRRVNQELVLENGKWGIPKNWVGLRNVYHLPQGVFTRELTGEEVKQHLELSPRFESSTAFEGIGSRKDHINGIIGGLSEIIENYQINQ